jgi:Calcineurin-like phosphoesterase/NACHT domain
MSANTLTWLHLSDLHACPTKTGWDANHVIKSLVDDLKELNRKYKLRPDFIFFTGDAAFGQLGNQPGESLQDQYKSVQQFIDEVRRAFRPELTLRDIYLVPGNHDINRDDVDDTQNLWLRNSARTAADIISMMQVGKVQWRRFMERLEDYKLFLKTNGYEHLLTDDKNRLIYADEREVAGLRIGIAGLNSAWSCFGGEEDKGRLWSGGKYQIEELRPLLSKVDFSIALIHHPGNWFVAREDPNVQRLLEASFEFVLHGHEHQEWIRTDAKTGHTTIWAGPCYEHSEKKNGFNIVQIDRKTGKGKAWLREYKETGRGWVASNIKGFAPQGIWTLDGLKWLQRFKTGSARAKPKNKVISKSKLRPALTSQQQPSLDPLKTSDRASIFEQRFYEVLARKYDYLELFGADIAREAQRHSLYVAYVSLSLTQEDDYKTTDLSASKSNEKQLQPIDKKQPFIGARPVSEVFDHLSASSGRLLVRGVAGGGKSTILRWAAIQAAKFNLEDRKTIVAEGDSGICLPNEQSPEDTTRAIVADPTINTNWRTRVPFLIRLRDCPNGILPRPKDWPALIAKELPDPPADWIDSVLTSGRGLVLLDGVDEVPLQKRQILAREIENLIGAYPSNYWLVSTRPGAVTEGWLSKLNFLEARIEPMSLNDQDEFIDKWYSAVALELRSTARRAENLEKLAASLKQELRESPGIARLAIYPLLCAMICALYRERNQKLPETQAALCEDLCKMLLHRRERETPDMSLVHLPPDYRKLDYEHKKYIVAELAKFMVDKGISSLDEQQADSLITTALQHFPDHAQANPQEMRGAFIERSGLLRPSGTDRIDFLHNTLKEYLAAGRFLAEDAYKLLASRADDDAWQPVILFAAALPTPGFASSLITELLKRLPKSRPQSKQTSKAGKPVKTASAQRRAREFFVVRCRNAAFRLEPALVKKVNLIASGLFPPNTIADAEVLANMGEIVIPHLNPKQRAGARQKVACIRALRLIGGPKAKSVLKSFVPGKAKSVLSELLTAAAELKLTLKLPYDSLDLSSSSAGDVSPLATSTNLRSLNLTETRVRDISPLARLKGLQSLNLSYTSVRYLSPLSALKNLRFLDLHQTKVNLASLGRLMSLQGLRLSQRRRYLRTSYMAAHHYYGPFQELSYIADILHEPQFPREVANFYRRHQRNRVYRDSKRERTLVSKQVISFLAREASKYKHDEIEQWAPLLEYFEKHLHIPIDRNFLGLLRQDPGMLERSLYEESHMLYEEPHMLYEEHRMLYEEPRRLYYHYGERPGKLYEKLPARFFNSEGRSGSLLSPLVSLKNLRIVDLSGLPIIDLSPLSSLQKIEALMLSATNAVDLSALSRLTQLKWLELSDSFASDFSALAGLTKLRVLDLNNTVVSNLSFLNRLEALEVLHLGGVQIRDIEPLIEMPSLRYLFLGGAARGDRAGGPKVIAQLRELREINRKLQIYESD